MTKSDDKINEDYIWKCSLTKPKVSLPTCLANPSSYTCSRPWPNAWTAGSAADTPYCPFIPVAADLTRRICTTPGLTQPFLCYLIEKLSGEW